MWATSYINNSMKTEVFETQLRNIETNSYTFSLSSSWMMNSWHCWMASHHGWHSWTWSTGHSCHLLSWCWWWSPICPPAWPHCTAVCGTGWARKWVSQLVLVGTGTAAAYNIGFTCTSPLTHHSLDTGLELWQIISLLVVFLHTLSEI